MIYPPSCLFLHNLYTCLPPTHTHAYVLQSGFTPIHVAASMNQSETIKILYKQDPTLVECPSNCQETPLMTGCLAGHIKVVRCLLKRGAKLHVKASDGSTVVHYAASSGKAEVLKHVLDLKGMKGSVNITNNVSRGVTNV